MWRMPGKRAVPVRNPQMCSSVSKWSHLSREVWVKSKMIRDRMKLEKDADEIMGREKANDINLVMRNGMAWARTEVRQKKRGASEVQTELNTWMDAEYKRFGFKVMRTRPEGQLKWYKYSQVGTPREPPRAGYIGIGYA